MKLFIGADHRGFEMKNKLLDWLVSLQYEVFDCGNLVLDNNDDWPDIAKIVVQKIIQKSDSLGILLCGSGAGVAMAANRHKGIYAGVSFNPPHAEHIRARDRCNVLCLPAEYISFDTAKEIITT